MYTQNIDGLERKVGLSTYHRAYEESEQLPWRCVPLHGTLRYLYCPCCQAIEEEERHRDELRYGIFPLCKSCQGVQEQRKKDGKRSRTTPRMIPDVLLYDQANPDEWRIADFQQEDLYGERTVDLLLVVGTGIHIPGTQMIIRNFVKHLRENKGDMSKGSLCSVYLNLEFRKPKSFQQLFDLWVQADCQLVARAVLNALTEGSEGQPPKKTTQIREVWGCPTSTFEEETDTLSCRGLA